MLVPVLMPVVQSFKPMSDDKLAKLIYLLANGDAYLQLAHKGSYDFTIRLGSRDMYFSICPRTVDKLSLREIAVGINMPVVWLNVNESDKFIDEYKPGSIYRIYDCPATDYRVYLVEYYRGKDNEDFNEKG